jgi:hypothetical protein
MTLRKPEKLAKINQQPIISPREEVFPAIMAVECTKEEITAFFEDGRKVSIPTDWYPRTRGATLKQLKNCRITSDKYGIH